MGQNYSKQEVVTSLKKKNSLRIIDNKIFILNEHDDLGSKSWGKIDYLVSNHDFQTVLVEDLPD